MSWEGRCADTLTLRSEFQVPTERMLSIKHLDWRELLSPHLDAAIRTALWFESFQLGAGNGLDLAGCRLVGRKELIPGPCCTLGRGRIFSL